MGVIQYQEKLIKVIDNYIGNNNLPHTLLLSGPKGCGKRTLSKYIAEKLEIEFIDITDNINFESLEQIQLSVTTKLYFIDGQEISVKEQNALLKFLEEPLKTAYIILSVEHKNSLLPTVLNRCVSISFDTYSKECLRTFLKGDVKILEYATTPGMVIELEKHNIRDMELLSNKILLQINVANYSNILKISSNINFSKEPSDLFDFSVFIHILLNVALELYYEGKISYEMFSTVSSLNKESSIPHINKQHLFERFIFNLKKASESV